MDDHRRFAALIGVFSAALFLALVICVSGLVSLATDTDVLVERHIGPLVAPVMFAVATAVIFALIGTAGARGRGRVVLPALGIGFAAYLLFLVTGAVLYMFENGRPVLGLLFIAVNSTRPYAITVLIVGIVVALGAVVLLRIRMAGGAGTTPRWPWEPKQPPQD